jgi:hypothetical protein
MATKKSLLLFANFAPRRPVFFEQNKGTLVAFDEVEQIAAKEIPSNNIRRKRLHRQLTLILNGGPMGAGVRPESPACCVAGIRAMHPSESFMGHMPEQTVALTFQIKTCQKHQNVETSFIAHRHQWQPGSLRNSHWDHASEAIPVFVSSCIEHEGNLVHAKKILETSEASVPSGTIPFLDSAKLCRGALFRGSTPTSSLVRLFSAGTKPNGRKCSAAKYVEAGCTAERCRIDLVSRKCDVSARIRNKQKALSQKLRKCRNFAMASVPIEPSSRSSFAQLST